MTIPALAGSAAKEHGPQLAIADGGTRLTYAELYDAAKGFGAALVAAGVSPGDRVAIWAPNSAEWVVAFLGLSQAGAALVPVNTRFKGTEAAEILRRSRARALVTVTDFLGTDYVAALRGAGEDLPDLGVTVVIQGPAGDGTVSWTEFLGAASAADVAELERRAAAVDDDDVSDILFTSGTTGVPKGVVQTHSRTLQVARDWVAMTGLRPGDRYLMVNPYFHMFGLKAGILASVAAGATMLPEPVFDVDRVLRRVDDEQVTVLPGAPTIYQSILDHPTRHEHELSSLRVAVTGAADIPVALIERILDELPFPTVIAGYGLTEGGTASATSPADTPETIATTVGRARPGFELRVVDGDGTDVPTGSAGEIVLRGGSVMSHYLDDPEATAKVLSPDGWLRTGDLGTLDEAGNLRIVGRAKDMFIVGGFNAYPAEIENALLRHADIQQAAVIGIPDDRLGEVGMAFLVLAPGSTTTAEDVITWSREQMANYKVPRRVEIIDALPLNATGKVVKDELRARAVSPGDPLLDLGTYAEAFASWLTTHPACLDAVKTPIPSFEQRVAAMRNLMGVLYDEGWSRYGWPEHVGGRGGTILHRATMWEALARHGVRGMAVFEHLEILAPALVAKGPAPFVATALPEFLAGRQLWAQGFSEPGAGSDLASLRTTARRDGDGYVVNGRKIWTSWARYATWCLLLARTGTPDARHRGLTAFVVDLRTPGVEVRAIEQANGTDELAEVAFDDVHVPADRVVGDIDGGWDVAMHILSHERGTFAWFRHCFLYQHLVGCLDEASPKDDGALGSVLLDLAAVTATGHAGLRAHANDVPLGPRAAYAKLLLCAAEQSVYDWILAGDPDLALDVADDERRVRRQEYLFSRIVTVYGGSQQMQLETIGKQILRPS